MSIPTTSQFNLQGPSTSKRVFDGDRTSQQSKTPKCVKKHRNFTTFLKGDNRLEKVLYISRNYCNIN